MKFNILALAAIASAAPAALDTCEDICQSGVHLIIARGTFEPQDFSLQQPVVDAIVKKIPGSDATQVVYPASPYNFADSIQSGVANAQKQMTDYYNACPDGKMVLLGYSQGAQVIGDAISGGGTGMPDGGVTRPTTPISQEIGDNVVAVVLFGDPNRVRGQGDDNAPSTCTVSATNPRPAANKAAMSFYADRLDEYCDAQDPVCCSTGNNIFAHLGYFTNENADIIANYVAAKAD